MMTPRRAFAPPDLSGPGGESIVSAVKAIAAGTATPGQQKMVLQFVMEELAGAFGLSYRPDDAGGERDTSFHEGRRFVGLQLRRIVTQPFDALTGRTSKKDTT